MPAIRDLLHALRRRPGIEGAVIVGRDGLVIDADSAEGIDAERIAAHLPTLALAADDVGFAAGRGMLTMAVLEHENGGLAVLAPLTRDVLLLALLDATADAGALIAELRRDRARLASFV